MTKKIEIRERCKGVHCVDLGESFPTSIYLQKSASIQPRMSRSKSGTWGICTRRAGKLNRARSQLYRSQFLQVNTRWKALAEIYTMHSFAPFWNPLAKNGEKRAWPKQPRKGENERPLRSSTLLRTSAKGGCKEKIARIKNEYAEDI